MPGPPPVTFATEAAIHLGGAEVQLHYLGPRPHQRRHRRLLPRSSRHGHGRSLSSCWDACRPWITPAAAPTIGWLPTLDNILKFDFDTVIPGHGPVSTKADHAEVQEESAKSPHPHARAASSKACRRGSVLVEAEDGRPRLGSSIRHRSSCALRAGGFYDELQASVKVRRRRCARSRNASPTSPIRNYRAVLGDGGQRSLRATRASSAPPERRPRTRESADRSVRVLRRAVSGDDGRPVRQSSNSTPAARARACPSRCRG